jgi:O-antigen/teichoic acid export membrane protein
LLSLRQKAIKGGAFLLVRQALGIVISIVGVLLVTRIIGPRQYGLFAAAAGIVTFLSMFGNWGLDVYLLRKTEDPEEKEFHQAFTILLLMAVVLCIGIVALRHTVAALLKMPEQSSLLFALALGIPLNLLALPAVVKLDRDLNFKQVAINELISQVCYYFVAVPLAFHGVGAWAPASGFLTQQAILLTLSYWTAKYRPGLQWESSMVKRMLGYGMSYSSSTWVYHLRSLVNPIIVGRFGGAEAVGYVAIGVRIASLLSFASSTTWRIAMPVLAKLSRDAGKLRNGITEGMLFQAVSVGFPLASFALLAPFLIPLGFGHPWIPAVRVFPFIAIGCLSNAMFNLHSSALYMLGNNMKVTWFHIVHIVLFSGSAMLLVPHMGFVGYGWAEVAALPSYVIIHLFLARAIGSPSYGAPAIWFATMVCVIVLGALGVPAIYFGLAFMFTPLLFQKERSTLVGYARVLFSPGVA